MGREMLVKENADRDAARAARVRENMNRCFETLREKDYCRNSKRHAEFNCYIKERGHQQKFDTEINPRYLSIISRLSRVSPLELFFVLY